jgi:hypothetical protein
VVVPEIDHAKLSNEVEQQHALTRERFVTMSHNQEIGTLRVRVKPIGCAGGGSPASGESFALMIILNQTNLIVCYLRHQILCPSQAPRRKRSEKTRKSLKLSLRSPPRPARRRGRTPNEVSLSVKYIQSLFLFIIDHFIGSSHLILICLGSHNMRFFAGWP